MKAVDRSGYRHDTDVTICQHTDIRRKDMMWRSAQFLRLDFARAVVAILEFLDPRRLHVEPHSPIFSPKVYGEWQLDIAKPDD